MLWAWVAAWVLVAWAPSEQAVRPSAVELTWTAPAGCPDTQTMLARIAALASVDPEGRGVLEVDARIEPHEGAYALSLRTTHEGVVDTQALVDRDCDALADTAALIVAVSIDPSATQADDASSQAALPPPPSQDVDVDVDVDVDPVPPSEPIPSPVEPRPPRSVEPTPAPPRPRPRGYVGLAGQLEYGALPGVSGGPRLSLGLQWARASATIYGSYGAPRRTDTTQGAAGLAQQGTGGARGCYALRPRSLRVGLCGVLEAGAIWVSSRGLDPPNTLTYDWIASGAHVGLERRFGRVGLFAASEALVPLRPTRVLIGNGTVFESWAVSARLIAGVRIFFTTDPA